MQTSNCFHLLHGAFGDQFGGGISATTLLYVTFFFSIWRPLGPLACLLVKPGLMGKGEKQMNNKLTRGN